MGGNVDDEEYITVLRPNDVLFGRGSGPNDHEGNIRFRSMVSERKQEYLATNRRQAKAQIAKEIVDAVVAKDGRFLKRADTAAAAKKGIPQGVEAWVQVDDNMTMEKAKQALRQNREKMPLTHPIPALGGDGVCQPQIDPSNPLLEHHTLSGITPYAVSSNHETAQVRPEVTAEMSHEQGPVSLSQPTSYGSGNQQQQPAPSPQVEVIDLYEPIPLTNNDGQTQAGQLYVQQQMQERRGQQQQQPVANLEAWAGNYNGPPATQQQQQERVQPARPLPQAEQPEVQGQNPAPYGVVSAHDVPAHQLLQDPRIAALLKDVPLEQAISSIEAARNSVRQQEEQQRQQQQVVDGPSGNGQVRRRQSTKVVEMEDLTENMRRMSTQSMAASVRDMFSESEFQDSNTTMGTIEQLPGMGMGMAVPGMAVSRRSFSSSTAYAGIKSSQSLNSSGSSVLRDEYDKQESIPEHSNEDGIQEIKPRVAPRREDSQTAFVISQIMENPQVGTDERNDISNMSMQMSDIWKSSKMLKSQSSSKGIGRKDLGDSPKGGGGQGSASSSDSVQPRPIKAITQEPDSMRMGDSSLSVMKTAMLDSVEGFSSSQLSISSEQMEALIRETSRRIS